MNKAKRKANGAMRIESNRIESMAVRQRRGDSGGGGEGGVHV